MKFLVQNNEKQGKTSKQISNIPEKKSDPQYFYYNIMNPSNKIQCDECKRDVTKATKILANDCDYCVGCFSNLQDIPQVYHVVNKMDFPLFQNDWTAEQQLLMFEGLEKHGFGNWSQIADFIGTNKTREEVQDHYTHIYLQAENFLPAKRQILSKRQGGKLIIKQDVNKTERKRNTKSNPKQTVSSNHQFQRGSLTVHNISAANKTGTNPAEIVGYMPKRGDFEVEYDNDAELLLAQMQFNDDDSEQEKQMKFRLMDIYNHKLNERIKRKEFVISRKLLDLKEQMRLDKMRTKEEKQIYNMMKVFSRFNTAQDHEKLVNGIIREKQIRQKIQELKQYKKKGFRTLADVQEQLQNKRKKEQKNKKKSQTELYGGGFGQKGNTRRSRKDVPVEKNQKRTTYLTKQQEDLCNKFNITFKQYMLIKETLIRQSIKQGIIEKDQSGKMFKIDRGISDGIFDFLVQKNEIIGK